MTQPSPGATRRRWWLAPEWGGLYPSEEIAKSENLPQDDIAHVVELLPGDVILSADEVAKVKGVGDIAKWMSAATDDPSVCAEMKADIESYFAALDLLERIGAK